MVSPSLARKFSEKLPRIKTFKYSSIRHTPVKWTSRLDPHLSLLPFLTLCKADTQCKSQRCPVFQYQTNQPLSSTLCFEKERQMEPNFTCLSSVLLYYRCPVSVYCDVLLVSHVRFPVHRNRSAACCICH